MKHEIKSSPKTGFQPFIITTTVETQEEADALGTLANCGPLGLAIRDTFPKLTGCLLPSYEVFKEHGADINSRHTALVKNIRK